MKTKSKHGRVNIRPCLLKKEREYKLPTGLNQNVPKVIRTEYLTIQGNCLEMPGVCIQLSNISLFTTSGVASEQSLIIMAAVAVMVGLVLMVFNVLIGLVAIALGGFMGYAWYADLQKSKRSGKLTITTNSGSSYSIVFGNLEFLDKVVYTITEIIREPQYTGKTVFNIKDNMIYGSAIGNDASVTGTR